MKKTILSTVILLLAGLTFGACISDHEDLETNFTVVEAAEAPSWQVNNEQGSTKYPVVTTYDATALLTEAGIHPIAGNVLAAFAGDECRGIAPLTSDDRFPLLTIYGRQAGETMTLKYYCAVGHRIFVFQDAISME